VPISNFFNDSSSIDTDPVVHSFHCSYHPFSPQILEATLSHNTTDFNLLPRLFQLMPLANMEDESNVEMYTHEGDEFLFVLEGILTVLLDGKRYTLYPGDSMQIHSSHPHNWQNTTNQITKLLYINCPNPFITGQPVLVP
jgi:mannose-6-phosphate isomerase-like protein (cupin superfamily)